MNPINSEIDFDESAIFWVKKPRCFEIIYKIPEIVRALVGGTG